MNPHAAHPFLHARDAAMDAYIDALLLPVAPSPRPEIVVAPVASGAQQVHSTDVPAATPSTAEMLDRADDARAVYRLCSVAGIQLAIPVGDIEAQHPLDADRAAEPGAPPWSMGVVECDGRRCQVINLAHVVAPALAPRAAPRVAITLVGGHWVLACDEIGEEITLATGDVRWRERMGDRPWLAGTALERRCAVLDVTGLSGLLSREMQHG